jgi:hypothetical protein
MKNMKNAYRILVGNPEGMRPLGKLRIILKWTLKKLGVHVYWNQLVQDRVQWWDVVDTVMNLWFHKGRRIH